jgi:hypothetical protein
VQCIGQNESAVEIDDKRYPNINVQRRWHALNMTLR